MKYVLQGIAFEWDSTKASINARKHGITFEQACEAFFDPFLTVIDASEDDEERDAIIAYDGSSRLLFVVHIIREGDSIRIISARRATRWEKLQYENQ